MRLRERHFLFRHFQAAGWRSTGGRGVTHPQHPQTHSADKKNLPASRHGTLPAGFVAEPGARSSGGKTFTLSQNPVSLVTLVSPLHVRQNISKDSAQENLQFAPNYSNKFSSTTSLCTGYPTHSISMYARYYPLIQKCGFNTHA